MQTDENAWKALGFVSILALVGTFICSVLFFKLIKTTNALFASTVSYFIPIVAVIWGVVAGEKIELLHIFGMSMILLGVYIARK
jgi:drug/metabolite transporter (DMT)-like permease